MVAALKIMQRFLFISVIFVSSEGWWLAKKERCYRHIGCFSDEKPFNNLNILGKKYLPASPAKIKPRFYLFTQQNKEVAEELFPYNHSAISSSGFDSRKMAVIIIHGFSSSSQDYRLKDMRKAFLEKFDYNVIMVDWSPGADHVNYLQAAANARVVGAVTAGLVGALKDVKDLDPAHLHLVGHSLGAHICGYVGRRQKGIGRITGLDPAGPFFEDTKTPTRLDPSDATFVDVIHTDGRKYFGFGMILPVGHVDFYPNNGKRQPACKTNTFSALRKLVSAKLDSLSADIACSHMRSILLFTESIRSSCRFRSCCASCPIQCTTMGLNVDRDVRGSYHLTTYSDSPFCRG